MFFYIVSFKYQELGLQDWCLIFVLRLIRRSFVFFWKKVFQLVPETVSFWIGNLTFYLCRLLNDNFSDVGIQNFCSGLSMFAKKACSPINWSFQCRRTLAPWIKKNVGYRCYCTLKLSLQCHLGPKNIIMDFFRIPFLAAFNQSPNYHRLRLALYGGCFQGKKTKLMTVISNFEEHVKRQRF